MKNKQRILTVVGVAVASFAVGILVAAVQVSPSQAQTGSACSLGTNDWCSKWSVARWIVDPATSTGQTSARPSDWQVNGTMKKSDGSAVTYTETWQMTRAFYVPANYTNGGSVEICRQADGYFNCTGGQSVALTNTSFLLGHSTNTVRSAEIRAQSREAYLKMDQQYQPLEWTVSGKFNQ